MQTINDPVTHEKNRLEAAFAGLENAVFMAIENAAAKAEAAFAQQQQEFTAGPEPILSNDNAPEILNNDSDVITQIQEIVKTHERKIVELKEEIGRLSVDLVRMKDENRLLKEQNKKASDLIGDSINAIEKLVAA